MFLAALKIRYCDVHVELVHKRHAKTHKWLCSFKPFKPTLPHDVPCARGPTIVSLKTGNFLRPELSSAGLGSAIASAVSSLTETKSHLSTLVAPADSGRIRPSLPPIRERESADSDHLGGWKMYVNNVKRWEHDPDSQFGVQQHPWQRKRFASESADGIAIRAAHFDEGAEKLVYKMRVRLGACVSFLLRVL